MIHGQHYDHGCFKQRRVRATYLLLSPGIITAGLYNCRLSAIYPGTAGLSTEASHSFSSPTYIPFISSLYRLCRSLRRPVFSTKLFKMKYLASALAFATAVAAHGYVSNATIGGKDYEFYQPYTDPYTSPKPQRISRPVQGNGPVENLAISDVQCGGYAAGGLAGSSPAALHAEVAAGSDVKLFWTLWPDSHMGPTITYMAKCPDAGCNNWMPESQYVYLD